MNILRLEYDSSEEGSYNDLIGQLIKKIRHVTTQVPAGELHMHFRDVNDTEWDIQKLDKQTGNKRRLYAAEIMDALKAESEIENNLREDLAWSLQTITTSLMGEAITPEHIDFEYFHQRHTYWVAFNGFIKLGLPQKNRRIVKDIVRSVCYQYGVVFVDCDD